MAKLLSKQPARLVIQMNHLIQGLERYPEIFGNRQPELVSSLTTARDDLLEALDTRTASAGAAERATQDLKRKRDAAHLLARQIRDQLYGVFTKYDARIVEFGLDTIRPRLGNGSNGTGDGSDVPPEGENESGDTTQP